MKDKERVGAHVIKTKNNHRWVEKAEKQVLS